MIGTTGLSGTQLPLGLQPNPCSLPAKSGQPPSRKRAQAGSEGTYVELVRRTGKGVPCRARCRKARRRSTLMQKSSDTDRRLIRRRQNILFVGVRVYVECSLPAQPAAYGLPVYSANVFRETLTGVVSIIRQQYRHIHCETGSCNHKPL